MAITQTATTSFKIELMQAVHNFGPTSADTFKIALYTSSASIGADTTAYSATNEVSSSGYTAGGNELVISTSPTASNNAAGTPTAYISFSTTTWTAVTFAARGALIYNVTQGDKSVAVLDFGSDKTVNNDTFQIVFPTAAADSAVVRIS